MSRIFKKVKVKKRATLDRRTFLSDVDLDSFLKLFPHREEELEYVEVIDILGVEYLVLDSPSLLALSTLSEDELEAYLGERGLSEIKVGNTTVYPVSPKSKV